jgi:ABC-type polysaccharide/polyol phosphate export permease
VIALADGWTMTTRNFAHWVRQPAQFVVGLAFPIMMVLMFGYVFGGAMTVPGGGSYLEFLLPGMFGMTMVFGLEGTAVSVASDLSKGVTDRFRALPIARSAVVVGRSLSDMLHSALVLVVMVGCGRIVGWDWHNGVQAALAALGLLLLLRFAFLWIGIYLGLLLGRAENIVVVQILVWPFGFLSSAFVATETMPAGLASVAAWNPISSTIAAARMLFGNPGGGADHAIVLAIVWPLVLLAIFVPLAVRRYAALSR